MRLVVRLRTITVASSIGRWLEGESKMQFRHTSAIVAAVTLCASHSSNAAIVQWATAAGGNGHFYEHVEDNDLSWGDAKAAAMVRPRPPGTNTGHLVTFSDAAENAFLLAAFPNIHVWIGLTDEALEGEWRWIDDTPGVWQDPTYFSSPIQTTFTTWGVGEPNNYPNASYPQGEDYAEWFSRENRFNDGTGPSGTVVDWLVEYEFVPQPEPAAVPGPSSLTLWAGIAIAGIVGRQRRRRVAANGDLPSLP